MVDDFAGYVDLDEAENHKHIRARMREPVLINDQREEGHVEATFALTDREKFKARVLAAAQPEDGADDDEDDEVGEAESKRESDESFSVARINRDYAVVLLGSKAVILKEITAGPIDDHRRFIQLDAFKTLFSNRYVEQRAPDGKTKTMSWATAWLLSPARRAYDGIEFFPDPRNAPGTPGYLNLWRGFAFTPAPKPNGYKTFRDHLLNNVCGGDKILFAWIFGVFAQMVQQPRERIGVAIVLRGRMGTGKTVVGEHIGALFPQHYFMVDDPRYVTGQFNAHMASCLLLQADEAVWAGDKAAEGRLKGLITSAIQQIEAKGIDPIRLLNYIRLIMNSNEGWVVPAGKDERRFAVFDVNPRCAGNHAYFREMAAELRDGGYAALLHDLLAFDLASVDLRTIPKTGALLDQKERSLDSVPSWWLGRLISGCSTRHVDGWETPIKKDALFADYIKTSDEIGIKRRREETIFHRELQDLIPKLTQSRTSTRTRGENGEIIQSRARCYKLPSLRDCRAAWDEAMGQKREWPPDDADEPEEASENEAVGDF